MESPELMPPDFPKRDAKDFCLGRALNPSEEPRAAELSASMGPIFSPHMWLLGLPPLGLIGGGISLGNEWQQRSWGWDSTLKQPVFAPQFGWNKETGVFAEAD
ncbi:MAG: hypothetical protein ACR2NX_11415 [Chthoniobacterales bacterium]